MARNSQVINAMGMIPESVLIWGRETAESLTSQVKAQDRNIVIAGLSKFVRQGTQMLMLGWGASLALEGQLTGGMMIAASIVGGRALAPIEGVIDGWRSFIQARSAYIHVKSLLLNSPLNFDRLLLPRPAGSLSVERILYVPADDQKGDPQRRQLPARTGRTRWRSWGPREPASRPSRACWSAQSRRRPVPCVST